MQIAFRPACGEDFDYCRRLYFAEMKTIIEQLKLDDAAQAAGFEQQWNSTQVRIIRLNGTDVGWLQSLIRDDGLFVGQLFVEGPFQNRGIGTKVMKRVIGEAAALNQAVLLSVAKINPAVRLYERLGFYVTHEDDRKFYMKRDPEGAAPISH